MAKIIITFEDGDTPEEVKIKFELDPPIETADQCKNLTSAQKMGMSIMQSISSDEKFTPKNHE